ncbi:GL16002 [Drosophila persimilis]|uniref:GL16002 n=1 Tax=Drosophila persimilis TaxID=7234 RepID=B4H9W3_DROPE|nr:GL16002 [Drosophila persimilis]
MVVILLLSPCTCSRSSSSSHAHVQAQAQAPPKHDPPLPPDSSDRSSNESSSASTGDTAIPASYLQRQREHQSREQHQQPARLLRPSHSHSHQPAALPAFAQGRWVPVRLQTERQPQLQPTNAVPKPPRSHGYGCGRQGDFLASHPSPIALVLRVQAQALPGPPLSLLPAARYTNSTTTTTSPTTNPTPTTATTTTTDYVRHVTRVNFYDIDTSQSSLSSRRLLLNRVPPNKCCAAKEKEWNR